MMQSISDERLPSPEYALAEAIALGVAAIDAHGVLTYVNPAFAQMVGWSVAELVGAHAPFVYWPEDELPRIQEAFARTVAGDAPPGGFELSFKRKDGAVFPVRVAVSATQLGGQPGWVAVITDITDQKLAEEALHDREQRLNLALSAGRLGSWEYQLDTGRVIWSPTLERIHGLEVGSFGGSFADYTSDIHPDDLAYVLSTIEKSSQGEVSHHLQYRIIWPNGEIHWLEASGMLFRNLDGEPIRMLGVCSDITERKAAEEQAILARDEAERANRTKSEFLAAMSHELRTPLNAIGGYLDLIDLEIHGPVTAAQRIAFGNIKRNQDHLLSVIDDLLNFAKLEAGRIEFRISDLPVGSFLTNMRPLLEPHAAARSIGFELEPVDDRLAMRADRERLQQILLNLVSNAVKFTPPGGEVRVHTSVEGGTVLVHVTDTGRGIPADQLETVFDAFVQVDRRALDSSEKGVGLGLTISRDLARGMGGELSVHSEVGKGSTFTIALPIVR